MHARIPLGATETPGELKSIASATLSITYTDGSTQTIIITGPTPGEVTVNQRDPEVFYIREQEQPVTTAEPLTFSVEFSFSHATHIKEMP